MITQDQLQKLPPILSEIIAYDRELHAFARQDVVRLTPRSVARFKTALACRNEARAAAALLWGYTARTSIGGSGAHA